MRNVVVLLQPKIGPEQRHQAAGLDDEVDIGHDRHQPVRLTMLRNSTLMLRPRCTTCAVR